MKNILFIVLALISIHNISAQKYNTIAGVRIGDDFGISAAQRIANKTTIELNIQPGTFAGRQMTSLLAKQHYSLLTKRLNFFMGAGIYSRKYNPTYTESPQQINTQGLALSFGAEFSIGKLSISTDYLPLVTIADNNSNQRFYTTSGFSLRYILVGRESSTKKFFKKIFTKKN
ncbi:MAG: hypothetical protein IPK35_07385 [Saprospiraceae bacterium]|nr:hypothetical protein [Saprospiraceae bacterium]